MRVCLSAPRSRLCGGAGAGPVRSRPVASSVSARGGRPRRGVVGSLRVRGQCRAATVAVRYPARVAVTFEAGGGESRSGGVLHRARRLAHDKQRRRGRHASIRIPFSSTGRARWRANSATSPVRRRAHLQLLYSLRHPQMAHRAPAGPTLSTWSASSSRTCSTTKRIRSTTQHSAQRRRGGRRDRQSAPMGGSTSAGCAAAISDSAGCCASRTRQPNGDRGQSGAPRQDRRASRRRGVRMLSKTALAVRVLAVVRRIPRAACRPTRRAVAAGRPRAWGRSENQRGLRGP